MEKGSHQYLVLRPVILEVRGEKIDLHKDGKIYLSYNNLQDAEKASERKYDIYELISVVNNNNNNKD